MRCCAIDVEWNVNPRTDLTAEPVHHTASSPDLYGKWAEVRSLIVKTLDDFPDALTAVSKAFALLDATPIPA